MVEIPEHAVKASIEAIDDYYDAPECVGEDPMKAALTAALPFLTGVKVKAGRAVCYVSKDGEAISDILDMPSDFIYDALKAKRDNEPAPSQRAQALEEAEHAVGSTVLKHRPSDYSGLSNFEAYEAGQLNGLERAQASLRALKSQPAPQTGGGK